MASKKKESEGIRLLAAYGDDEEEDEMEDAEDEDREDPEEQPQVAEEERPEEPEDELREAPGSAREDSARAGSGSVREIASDSGNDNTPQLTKENWTPTQLELMQQRLKLEAAVSVQLRRRREKLSIVDYAHDEVAMSPEAEEGEIEGSGYEMFGERLQNKDGDPEEKATQETLQVLSPTNQAISLSSEPMELSQPDMRNLSVADAAEVEDPSKDSVDIDPLDKFLLPPPTAKCSEELQEKVRKFILYKRAGKSFNAEVRNRKDYRNPDFLLHAVRYQEIDQIGSCFSKDVFDPHGYDPSDYWDAIEADMKREAERKEQERKKNQQIEFVSVGNTAGAAAAAAALPKVNAAIAAVSTAAVAGLRSSDPVARDGRQNKKSKWDKVDGDRKNPLPSGGQESLSTVGTHAAILSAANAGAGYTAFAQQRRREAEERRSGERKLDRRS